MNATLRGDGHHRDVHDFLIDCEEYSMRQGFLEGAEMMTGTLPGSIAFGSDLAGEEGLSGPAFEELWMWKAR